MTKFLAASAALAMLGAGMPAAAQQTFEECRGKAQDNLNDYKASVCSRAVPGQPRRNCEARAAEVYMSAVNRCTRDDNARRAREAAKSQPR